MTSLSRSIILILTAWIAMVAVQAQTPPAVVVPEPAPVGIGATPNLVLFSQPFSDAQPGVPRGIYVLGGPATPLLPLPTPSPLAENYFAVASGLGGFTAGDLFVFDLSTGSGRILTSSELGPLSLFNPGPFAGDHVSPNFDRVGTFGFNLIVTGDFGVRGIDAAGNVTFFYPSPTPLLAKIEGSRVAPLSYAPCPGCLFIVTEPNNLSLGGIYVIHPGAPSFTIPELFATGPSSPETIHFPTANACTNNAIEYFASGFTKLPNISPDPNISSGGAILGWTAAQVSPFIGKFLVADEFSGIIYAYNGPDVGGLPDRTVFSNTGYQMEGQTLVTCPVQTSTKGFMTGGGQTANSAASHGMEVGCDVGSNHHNLEINWAGGNNFHMDTITSVTCYLDPALPDPAPPPAGFNTMVLNGTGTYNNQPGAAVFAIFTDAGEPGTNDQALIQVTFNASNVLNVPFATIATGNQQAHK
jgi:hypothetical protein